MAPGGAISLLAALTALGASAATTAAPPRPPGPADGALIRIDFEAPAGCSAASAFREGILSRIDRAAVVRARDSGVRLVVRLGRAKGGGAHGELRLIDGHGETDTRKVDGTSCAEVVEVLALTAAIAIDPAARPAPSAPGAAPTAVADPPARAPSGAAVAAAMVAGRAPGAAPEPGAPAPAVASSGVVVPAAPGARRALLFGVAAQTVAAKVLSPSFNVGVGVALRLTARRATAGGAGAVAASSSPSIPSSVGLALLYLPNDLVQSPSEVSAHLTALELTACPGWGFAASGVSVQPCVAASGGWLSATGLAVTNPRSAGRSWWSAGAMARAIVGLGAGFSAQIEAGASLPLVARRFVTATPDRTVAETPTVAAQVGLGLGYGL